MSRAVGKDSRPPTAPSDLSRLVQVEAELEARIGAARDEERRIVHAARDEAAALEHALETDLAAAGQRVLADAERERVTRAAEVVEDGRRAAARFADVPAPRIAELARYLVDRLIGGESP